MLSDSETEFIYIRTGEFLHSTPSVSKSPYKWIRELQVSTQGWFEWVLVVPVARGCPVCKVS